MKGWFSSQKSVMQGKGSKLVIGNGIKEKKTHIIEAEKESDKIPHHLFKNANFSDNLCIGRNFFNLIGVSTKII